MIRFVTKILDVLNVLGMQRIVPPVNYTIRFVNWDGTILQESQVIDGETPVYAGATPERAHDTQYTYIFNGWLPSIEPATEDKTYTAQYTAIPIPAPDPLRPANELWLSSETGSVSFIPKFSGTAQYQYTLNNIVYTETIQTSDVQITVSHDIGTYVVVTGLTGIGLRSGCSYAAVNNQLTELDMRSPDINTLDLRNAGVITNTSVYDGMPVSKIYDTANNLYTMGAITSDIIEFRSSINDGYVYINANGAYAQRITEAANARGWTVLYL